MFRSALVAAFVPGVCAKLTWEDVAANPNYSFDNYVSDFGKTYDAAEYAEHEVLFNNAFAKIKAHNADPKATWKMGLNRLTDASPEETQRMKGNHRGLRFAAGPMLESTEVVDVSALPASVDWREKNVVSPVKDQGGCGSCWAFASTETVESAVAIATGKAPPVLAPQELVSCAPNPDDCGGTGGCQGSTEPLAFQYVQKVGMTTEAIYPYQGVTGTCDKSKVAQSVVSIKNYTRLPTNNYGALMKAVATVGPIAISVDADWGGYESGVYSGACGNIIDHAVQLVGYGSDEASGLDYWLVRNSWGASWGENGYIRIKRFGEGKEPCGTDTSPGSGNGCKGGPSSIKVCGLCGILSDSSYVTGAAATDASIVV